MADVFVVDVEFSGGVETVLGTRATGNGVYELYEPNTIETSGDNFVITQREPLSNGGQRGKGRITDKNSSFGFSGDYTLAAQFHLTDPLFAANPNEDISWRGGVSASSNGYTIPTPDSSARSKIFYSSSDATTLVYARGFVNEQNNGLKPITQSFSSGNILRVSGNASESATPQTTLEVAGVRMGSNDLSLAVASNGRTATLTEIANNFDFRQTGIIPGQDIIIGGEAAVNRFNAGILKARVLMVNANTLILDDLSENFPRSSDSGSGKRVDIYYGGVFRNVPRNHDDFRIVSKTIETAMPGLGPSGETYYEYQRGNVAGNLTITVAATDKITYSMTGLAIGTDIPTATRATGASTARRPVGTSSMSTATDIGRLSIRNRDDNESVTYFRNFDITVNRNLNATKKIGRLDPKNIVPQFIDVSVTGVLDYDSPALSEAILNQETASFVTEFSNEEGGAIWRIPAGLLSSDGKVYNPGEEVGININLSAFADPAFNHTIIVSTFPFVPQMQ